MRKIRIFTDSISDIPQEWIETYHIGLIPLYIVFEEKSLRDRVEINTQEMYQLVKQLGRLPKTAAPSPVDFFHYFYPVIDGGEDILYISMSSKLSSTYQNSLVAARGFPPGRVIVVDSLNISAGMAIQVLLASRMSAEGNSAISIAEALVNIRSKVQMNVLVDNLDYLHKGGRVGNLQHMLGSMLRIRPLLYVSHGRVFTGPKYRGSKKRIIKNMMHSIFAYKKNIEQDPLIIAHTMEEENASWIRNMILEETGIQEVHIIEGGCAISSHSGPHSLGISYIVRPS